MSFKLIIFDLDLTLIDTRKQICDCFVYAFNKLNIKVPSEESMCKQIGIDLPVTFRNLLPELSDEQIQELKRYFVQHATDKAVVDSIKLYEDALPLLNFIKNEKLYLGLLTSKPRWLVERIIDEYKLQNFFKNNNIFAEDEVNNKPSPDGIYKLIELFNVNADEVLYIGDGVVDAQTAQAANVAFLAVLTGVTKKEEFQEYFNIGILNNLSEVKNFIAENEALGPM